VEWIKRHVCRQIDDRRRLCGSNVRGRGRRYRRTTAVAMRIIATIGVVTIALVATAAAVAKRPLGQASGDVVATWIEGGTYTYSNTLTFTAQGTADGPRGDFNFTTLSPFGDFTSTSGIVVCYSQSGNEAVFTGLITANISPFPGYFIGRYVVVTVVDNGEGSSALPDQFGIAMSFATAPDCAVSDEIPQANLAVTSGNIQVH
jgi:hypothetical protein